MIALVTASIYFANKQIDNRCLLLTTFLYEEEFVPLFFLTILYNTNINLVRKEVEYLHAQW